MNIYLDLCCLQRPMDRKEQLRVILEAEAILSILAFCADSGRLVTSETLVFEAGQSRDETRREHSISILRLSREFVKLTKSVEHRAKQFQDEGLKPMDSFHLASAESGKADYFCTCDDRLINQCRKLNLKKVRVVTPLELVEEIVRWKQR